MTKNKDIQSDELPDDLGLKLGTREEVIWTEVAKEAKVLLEQYNKAIIVQKGILDYSQLRIAEEKDKF